MDTAAIAISIIALLFALYSFWWMHWRTGKLLVTHPKTYAAHGSDQGKLVIELPFVFVNTGPAPIVVRNLRLLLTNETSPIPLSFVATVNKLGSDEGRAFATQFPVHGNQALALICEFQRSPGQLLFQSTTYSLRLEAQLANQPKWRRLAQFNLCVSDRSLESINRQFIVHENIAP
jgi:hypothetical protein